MNPKEKADELIGKCFMYANAGTTPTAKYHLKASKELALICAEEVLHKVQSIKWLKKNNHKYDEDYTQEYWIKVKQEIKNYEQHNN